MYFALDSKTGITSQADHDPWKWAQDVGDKMANTEESCLVFIGAPPASMGLPIFPNLPNNQAFVNAKYLKIMVSFGFLSRVTGVTQKKRCFLECT